MTYSVLAIAVIINYMARQFFKRNYATVWSYAMGSQ